MTNGIQSVSVVAFPPFHLSFHSHSSCPLQFLLPFPKAQLQRTQHWARTGDQPGKPSDALVTQPRPPVSQICQLPQVRLEKPAWKACLPMEASKAIVGTQLAALPLRCFIPQYPSLSMCKGDCRQTVLCGSSGLWAGSGKIRLRACGFVIGTFLYHRLSCKQRLKGSRYCPENCINVELFYSCNKPVIEAPLWHPFQRKLGCCLVSCWVIKE